MEINDLSNIVYEIDKNGKNLFVNGKRKHTYLHRGYEVAWIDYKQVPVHRLVALKYIPNPFNKPIVNHINSIRNDNRIENLEWVTHRENIKHEFNLGKNIGKGRKLKKEDIIKIKELYATEQFTQKQLGDMFGVSGPSIHHIIKEKQYKFI